MTIDLTTLDPPQIVEELDFEAIVARQKAQFASVWSGVRAANPDLGLPDYDVSMLETDPAVLLTESESYREILIRQRINEAVKATLLAFASNADLDHLGAFYDLPRMTGELDDRYKTRIVLAIQGRSTGGTEARYKLIALSADLTVADAVVYTVGRSPVVHVGIFSTDPDGVASTALLAKVNAALQVTSVRMVNDTIVVGPAVRTVVNLAAGVWLLPDADDDTITRMEAALRAAWAKIEGLDRDLAFTWWTSKLMIDGVHSLEAPSPAENVIADPAEALSIGTVSLPLLGRKY